MKEFQANGGDIRFAEMKAEVLDIFHILELDTFFYHFNNLNETIKSFSIFPTPKAYMDNKSKTKFVRKAAAFVKDEYQELNVEKEKLKGELKILKNEIRDLTREKSQLAIQIKKLNQELKKRQTIFWKKNNTEIGTAIKKIIEKHPEYGPKRILNFLYSEMNVHFSESTLYRRLCLLNLNTKEKRELFAKNVVEDL